MGRIRLQICVLPWEQPGLSPSSSAQTRQETLKWCEPCAEDTSMQEVCDRILRKWSRMFEASMGPLRIRHLKTAYGDFVDLEEQVVGDLFDDRGADGNIRNSILEVHRYPPKPDELETIQRFSSLAPNSSARPRKRPLELSSHFYHSQNLQNQHRKIPSIEESDAETSRPFGTATKRRRTQEPALNRTLNAHQPSSLREEQRSGLNHSSQTSGTQESIHQVLDSQKSPGKRNLNPYGTPTSLSLIGPQEPDPTNEIDLSAVPDSPLGRETKFVGGAFGGPVELDRDSTKSESPELRTSVHEVPSADPQPSTSADSPERATTPFFNSASQTASIQWIVEDDEKNHGLSVRQTGEKTGDIDRLPKRKPSTADPAHARNSDPVFDPIESDTESFHEKQQMQSVKRLRSSKTKSPRASNIAGDDCRNGQFLVPSVPQSRTNGTRISLGEVSGPGQRENFQESERDHRYGVTGDQDDPKRHGKHDAEALDHVQSVSCDDDRTNISRETAKRNSVNNDFVDAAQTSSQATTAWLRDSSKSADATGESAVQQRDDLVTSQEQEPDETTHLVHNANGVICNPGDDRFAQEADRLAEEQQEKKKIREKKAEERKLAQEAVAKEIAAKKKEAAERNAHEVRLADEKRAKEEKAEAERLAQAKKAEETRVNAARLAEEKKTSEKLARERQTREAALAEKAKKEMLAADGAKQIEVEKKEKEKEKARCKELAAKKQADEAKAEERARKADAKDREKEACEEQLARKKAHQPASIEFNKQQIQQAGTAQETATALKKHVQKSRSSSEVQNRASPTPSVSFNAVGPKRSMTPVIPGSSVAQSSSHQTSLASSPLSNRSSSKMDAPLRSALRQTSSGLRRSVSSVSFDVPPRSKLNGYIPSTSNAKSNKEIETELATKPSSASKTTIKVDLPKKAPGGKIAKTAAKNGKYQTKLNITSEVKKPKGRDVNPPVTSMQAPKQEIVLSSGEDSSTSEEPVWQTGNAKAGPSSRRPAFPVTTSEGKKIGQVKSGASIDPVIWNINVEKDRTAAPAIIPCSTSQPDRMPLQKSTSRSPALALSETYSLSSGSASGSASSSQSELKSDSRKLQAPSSKTPNGTESGKLAPVTMKEVSKAVNVRVENPDGYIPSRASSLSNHALSSRSRSTISVHDDGRHVDQAADKQLLLESRRSAPSSIKQAVSSTTSGTADKKVINQGLDHAGRLPNGIRPAYYKYPALSELKQLPRAATPEARLKPDKSSSQALDALPVEDSGSDSSSSSSDSSSSDSDEDQDVKEPISQTGSKQKSSLCPDLKGVLKTADILRSKLGLAKY